MHGGGLTSRVAPAPLSLPPPEPPRSHGAERGTARSALIWPGESQFHLYPTIGLPIFPACGAVQLLTRPSKERKSRRYGAGPMRYAQIPANLPHGLRPELLPCQRFGRNSRSSALRRKRTLCSESPPVGKNRQSWTGWITNAQRVRTAVSQNRLAIRPCDINSRMLAPLRGQPQGLPLRIRGLARNGLAKSIRRCLVFCRGGSRTARMYTRRHSIS